MVFDFQGTKITLLSPDCKTIPDQWYKTCHERPDSAGELICTDWRKALYFARIILGLQL